AFSTGSSEVLFCYNRKTYEISYSRSWARAMFVYSTSMSNHWISFWPLGKTSFLFLFKYSFC
ncbi:MAG: hypothetical protein ACOC30_02930, partial [Marinilabilia sp.]